MHIQVTGEGAPTVVFESGMGASCLSWTLVQPQVAQFTRAVSYDRAGHGWSDPARERRTAEQIAQELHTLLDAAAVPGPYVLVGHSFGGYVNRAFAHMYRDEVVGMVLVDSIHPAEWENPTPKQLRNSEVALRYAWIAAWLARLGVVRFCLARLARGSPRLAWAAVSAFGVETAAAAQRITGEIRKLTEICRCSTRCSSSAFRDATTCRATEDFRNMRDEIGQGSGRPRVKPTYSSVATPTRIPCKTHRESIRRPTQRVSKKQVTRDAGGTA
jgi:pimeloyl-ACP methyl ester carboxylesterase